MKKILYLFFIGGMVMIGSTFAHAAHAADLTVDPAVIDGNGLPRDILDYKISVTNTTDHLVNVFASAYDLTADGRQQFEDPGVSDRPALLVDWMQVTRGAMLFQPGETKTIPVEININPYAVAGEYHAVIAFVEGGTRADAETHLDGAPQTLINMTVASDIKEDLQIVDFGAKKGFSSAFPVDFTYTIENDGNVTSTPQGTLAFYDQLGRELGSVDANPAAVGIPVGGKQQFSATWTSGPNFGQYKALLHLTYGASGAVIEKTAIFWILPWMKLLIIFGTLFIIFIFLAVWLHKKYEKRHYRRMRAIEHILKKRSVIDLRHPNDQ